MYLPQLPPNFGSFAAFWECNPEREMKYSSLQHSWPGDTRNKHRWQAQIPNNPHYHLHYCLMASIFFLRSPLKEVHELRLFPVYGSDRLEIRLTMHQIWGICSDMQLVYCSVLDNDGWTPVFVDRLLVVDRSTRFMDLPCHKIRLWTWGDICHGYLKRIQRTVIKMLWWEATFSLSHDLTGLSSSQTSWTPSSLGKT